MEKSKPLQRITENTLISLNLLVVIVGLAIWLVRLNDKIDSLTAISDRVSILEKKMYRIEMDDGIRE